MFNLVVLFRLESQNQLFQSSVLQVDLLLKHVNSIL